VRSTSIGANAVVNEVRISFAAREDLRSIAVSSEDMFGAAQATRYRQDLQRALELLAVFPSMGTAQDRIENGLRRHAHASHAIYYSVQPYGILIERILGPGQDPAREFEP
jgi:toxin ParE1/3/4